MALNHRPIFADKKVITCALCFIQLACSRRSDSRARRSEESELNCTPRKQGGGGGGGGGGRERENASPPFPPLVFFLRELFSRALLSERLEQAIIQFVVYSTRNPVVYRTAKKVVSVLLTI